MRYQIRSWIFQLVCFVVISYIIKAATTNQSSKTTQLSTLYKKNKREQYEMNSDNIKQKIRQQTYNSKPQQYVLQRQQRLLLNISAGKQHEFRIFPHVNKPPENSNIDQSMLTKAMSIAGTYFKKALTVTDRHTMFETMMSSFNPICNTALRQYKYKGFNPKIYDAVIATNYQKQSQQHKSNVVAFAVVCKKLHWTIYGTVTFITDNFSLQKDQSNIEFYKKLMTIVHEYIHIFAINSQFFDQFYKEYQTQNSIYDIKQTILKSPKNSSQYMVVSPIVKSYIQNLFNCPQNVGAIFQQLAENGTQKSHWNQIVFYDQLEISGASNFLFITNLTLSLFGDSHFFKSVNYSMGEPIAYGKGKGCEFAFGEIRPQPQFCYQQIYDCDFYNLFKGVCIKQNTNDTHQISKMRDFDSQTRDFSDPTKRCIKSGIPGSWKFSYQKAYCSQNKVTVQIENKTIICKQGGQKVEIGKQGKYVVCPNPQVFCARKLCSNWCAKEGICVRGQCLIDSPVQKQQLRSPGLLFLGVFSIFFCACLYFCWTSGSPASDQIQSQSMSNQN